MTARRSVCPDLPDGASTGWHLHRMAPAPDGTCTGWHLHRMVPAPDGTCPAPLPSSRKAADGTNGLSSAGD